MAKSTTILDRVEEIISTEGLPFKSFMQTIPGKLIERCLPDHRASALCPEIMICAMMCAGIEKSPSMSKSLARINADRKSRGLDPLSSSTAAYSKARSRIPNDLLKDLSKSIAAEALRKADDTLDFQGLRPKFIDGTTIIADDTKANQAAFPQSDRQSKGVGFPIIRAVVLQDYATAMIESFRYTSYQGKGTGEMVLAREILKECKEGDLIIGDAYFPSYFTMAYLISNKIEGLFPSHGLRVVDYRRGQSLGTIDHLTKWKKPRRPEWMNKEEYENFPAEITVREFGCIVKGERRNFVTSLLDHEEFSKDNLSQIFMCRWDVELLFRDLKITMGLDHIHAKTPESIEKTIWSTILGYNVIRWHQAVASKLFGSKVRQISIQATVNIVLANIKTLSLASRNRKPRILAGMYYEISQNIIGNRQGRREPRKIKKRPKQQELLKESRKSWSSRH